MFQVIYKSRSPGRAPASQCNLDLLLSFVQLLPQPRCPPAPPKKSRRCRWPSACPRLLSPPSPGAGRQQQAKILYMLGQGSSLTRGCEPGRERNGTSSTRCLCSADCKCSTKIWEVLKCFLQTVQEEMTLLLASWGQTATPRQRYFTSPWNASTCEASS